jgi:hypothetical protein
MNDKQRYNVIKQGIEMYESLNNSIDEAGGTRIESNALEKMTVMDLISILSINDIRFIFQKSNKASNAIAYIDNVLHEITMSPKDDYVSKGTLENIREILSKPHNG